MPNYISKIDFGDGVQRKVRVQSSGGGITDFADIPTVEDTEFDYDGTQKELVFTGLDTDKVTVSGTTSATEAGTYTCTLTLKSNSYAWKDLTQEPKTIEWEIVVPAHIYGVLWEGTSATTWTRTDDSADFTDPNPAVNNGTGSSPFDNLMPWSGMQIVEDSEAGTLVSIPKYWYKWTRDGAKMKLQISNGPQEGFLVSPAHSDRGDGQGERDVVYVGRYHCGDNNKSVNGQWPLASLSRNNFRTRIHNLGNTIWQYDFAMYWTIRMLYLVEYANWNSQRVIGYGCSPSGSLFNMGYTDSMQYHTGTTATDRFTFGGTQYRYIEGLWDNAYDFCDGIYFSGTNVYCIKNPANFSDSSGGTLVGTRASSNGYIKGWTNPTESGFEYALYPNVVGGKQTTYVCDSYYYNASGTVLYVGGNADQYQYHGAFSLYGTFTASNVYTYTSSRLMKLP